jgi:hypothetical protein
MAKAIQIVKVDKDYRGLLAALNKMDDVAKNDMRAISQRLALRAGAYAKASAKNSPYNPKQAVAVAESIKFSINDKAPSFSIGGRQKVGASAFTAGYVIMGSEFGANQYKQFPRRSPKQGRGNKGWWLYPAMSAFHPTISKEWLAGYEKIASAWKGRAQ